MGAYGDTLRLMQGLWGRLMGLMGTPLWGLWGLWGHP